MIDEYLQTFTEYPRNYQQKKQVNEGKKLNRKFPENSELMSTIFEIESEANIK